MVYDRRHPPAQALLAAQDLAIERAERLVEQTRRLSVAAALPLARRQRSDFLAREGTHRLLEMHPICERGEQGEAFQRA